MSVAAIPYEFLALPLDSIDEPALPSRSTMDDEKLDQLVESVRANGLHQPLVVARVGERYEVIAGHRRWHACKRAGMATVPCKVYADKVPSLIVIQAEENSRREDLNPADEAIWFMQLLDEACGGDIEKLSAMVGEKVSYIDNRIALYRGDAEVFKALQDGQIKIGVAQVINKCPSAHWRHAFLVWAVQNGANTAAVEGWLFDWKRNHADIPPAPASSVVEEPGMPIEPHNPFTCIVCGKSDRVHLIRQVNVHQHCELAILQPLLATYRGES